ncbi:hypothetical protein ILYODFUR_002384 [Ilyodon furcidens]|uniref:Uncharacterized protein n=1 Tax=Ilyodon furcidens TaxID=33524 RepID=A0ABV0T4S1_9TELE
MSEDCCCCQPLNPHIHTQGKPTDPVIVPQFLLSKHNLGNMSQYVGFSDWAAEDLLLLFFYGKIEMNKILIKWIKCKMHNRENREETKRNKERKRVNRKGKQRE